MRKFVCAAIVTVCTVSVAMAAEFTAAVTKIEGNKITFKRTEKGKVAEDAKEETMTLANDAKVFKGKGKKGVFETVGDALEKADYTALITKGIEGKKKSANVHITTDADNKQITRILIIQGKKVKDAAN